MNPCDTESVESNKFQWIVVRHFGLNWGKTEVSRIKSRQCLITIQVALTFVLYANRCRTADPEVRKSDFLVNLPTRLVLPVSLTGPFLRTPGDKRVLTDQFSVWYGRRPVQ